MISPKILKHTQIEFFFVTPLVQISSKLIGIVFSFGIYRSGVKWEIVYAIKSFNCEKVTSLPRSQCKKKT